MTFICGQRAVTGTVPIFTVPPGSCNVIITAAAAGAFIGTSTALTTSNGYAVQVYPTAVPTYPGSTGAQMFATTGTAATTIAVSWIISTNE